MRVVVTGGAGFIGTNLVRLLVEDGVADAVTVLDDLSSGSRAGLDGLRQVRLLEGSILDERVLEAACDGADAVVHLAAMVSVPASVSAPAACHEVDATGTVRVLDAARRAGNAHVVLASSAAVYGDDPGLPKHEELPPAPQSPYAAAKLASEAYARAYADCYDLPVLPFRFFNVFGPLQPVGHAYAAVVPAFVSAAVRGRPLTVHGDGLQTRDFVFVRDVAAVLADAVRRRVTSRRAVNLACGARTTLLEVVTLLERILGHDLELRHTPPRAGDVRHSQASQERLRSLFPELRPTPLETGLRATVEWFQQAPQEVTGLGRAG